MVFIEKFKFEFFYGSVLSIMITEVWEMFWSYNSYQIYITISKHTLKISVKILCQKPR